MKSVLYFLTILFLSLLLSCSEEPPTSVETETLTKKPIKDPPVPPPALVLESGKIHLIAGSLESSRGKNPKVAFRVWTDPYSADPQIRVHNGSNISVAIYNIDEDLEDELLVYIYYKTGKGRNEVEHFELQIWQDGDEGTPTLPIYDLDGFNVRDIVIGELDGDVGNGDEIVLVGNSEFRIYNPQLGDFYHPIKTIYTGQYNVWWRSTTIGDADNDNDNDIVFASMNPHFIVVCDYGPEPVAAMPYIGLCDRVEVADVDGDDVNEIIWGGALGEMHIVEFDKVNFIEEWKSDFLGGYIFGLSTGDFDGDTKFEIAVGTAGGVSDSICVFDYDGSKSPPYVKTTITPLSEGVGDMIAGNADGDPEMEFVVATGNGVLVYDYSLGGYNTNIFTADNIGVRVKSIYLK